MAEVTSQRQLGFWMCTALVIGNTIGMGIFVLPASLAPYGFNASIGWLITVVGCLLIALVFARLARMMPRANGPYDYIRYELGELPAFIALWCYWDSLWITNAAIATGVVGYLREVLPGLKTLPATGIALVLLWTFVAINLTGTRSGGRLQVVTTLLKLLPMLGVIVLGAWLLATTPEAYSAYPPSNPIGFSQILPASTIALFAMLGVESAAVPASPPSPPRGCATPNAPFRAPHSRVRPSCDLPPHQHRADAVDSATHAGGIQRTIRPAAGSVSGRRQWPLAVDFRRHQRTRCPERLDLADRRADPQHGAQRCLAAKLVTFEQPRRTGSRLAAHRSAGQWHGLADLLGIAGRRLHLHHLGGDRRQPAPVSVLRRRAVSAMATWSRRGIP